MEEAERRLSYHYGRVLIETARVLSPQFSDSLVCLTGAELEMLRNMTAYLGRRDTYVSTYDSTYYLVPDDEDWDDIAALVAELENKLMVCPKAILSPDKSSTEFKTVVCDGSPYVSLTFATVPQDRVRTVDLITAQCAGDVADAILFQIYDGSDWRTFNANTSIATGALYKGDVPLTLEEDQALRVLWVNPAYGDTLNAFMVAYDWEVD